MKKPVITIVQRYGRDMNIYGDDGNLLVLKKRLEWKGACVNVVVYNPGDVFPRSADIVIGGGGQDSGQDNIQQDLLKIGDHLKRLAERGVPMLMVCGLYQLFGHSFKTSDGHVIKGIGLLDVKTVAGPERLIGNIVTESKQFGTIIGYENHSGQTFLGKDVQPLAEVRVGAGNNLRDVSEGARYKHVIGTYLHGSLLPKNPAIADYLIETAFDNKGILVKPKEIDDSFAVLARAAAAKRPR